MAQRVVWNIARKRMLEDRGAMPREVGDSVREHGHAQGHGRQGRRSGNMRRTREEETKSGQKVVGGELQRIFVNHERVYLDPSPSSSFLVLL